MDGNIVETETPLAGMALFLFLVLSLTTLLLCYAGYIFLVVDRRAETKMVEDSDLFQAIDDKNYDFELPAEIDEYEELQSGPEPTDKRTMPLKLLERAKADIPRIEQLEKDHPRMARLFQKGLLPYHVWEQLLEAEQMMDSEVNTVQAEAERLQKGWGQGVFSQAYQMLRKDREDEVRMEQMQKEAAVLTLKFTKPSGGVVTMEADGRKVTQQTPMVIRKESAAEEITFKSEVTAELTSGAGEEKRVFCAVVPTLELDVEQEKQWKQIGSDPAGLRLQVRFVRRSHGAKAGFAVEQIRVTVPDSAKNTAIGAA